MENIATKDVEKKPGGKKTVLILILALAVVIGAMAGWYMSRTKTVAVASLPEQLSYDYGAQLNTQGLSLLVTNNLGKAETITEGFVCDPLQLNAAGQQQITVTYGGKSDVFTVEVTPVLTEIAVAAMPEDTGYLSGEALNLQGFSLEARYNDGSTQTVEDYVCQPMTVSDAAGMQEITVSYEDKTTVFEVEVLEVESFTVDGRSANRTYMVGDIPDPAGAVLNVAYTNGTTETVETGFACLQEPFAETGDQAVTVTYGGKEATYTAQVYPRATFENGRCFRSGGYYQNDPVYGRNLAGDPIYWAVGLNFTIPASAWNNFAMTVTCSWTEEVSGLGPEGWVCGYDDAKDGKTFVEWGTFGDPDANDNQRLLVSVFLPDDPSIAGEQWIEIGFGSAVKRIPVTLVYEGDYETGMGWDMGEVSF